MKYKILTFLFCVSLFSLHAQVKRFKPSIKTIEIDEFKSQSTFVTYPNFSKQEPDNEHFTEEEALNAHYLKQVLEKQDILEDKIKEIETKKEALSAASLETKEIHFSMPLEDFKITSHFGNRNHPVLHKMKNHRGLDLRANHERVFSILNGTVTKVAEDKSSGKYIEISYQNYIVKYLHLSSILVFEDQEIKAGNTIAISGATGAVTAPHLHLEVLRNGVHIDPTEFLIKLLTLIYNKQ